MADEASEQAGPRHKSGLLIVFVTVFIDLLGFGIVLPLLPRYAEYYHARGMVLGLLMASFSAMQFIFSPIWGRLSDFVGRRPILILGLAGSTISYGLFGIVSSLAPDDRLLGLPPLTWLFLTRLGAGVAGATISTAQAYIADVTPGKERARGMAMIGAAFGIGFTFGPLLGAFFVSNDPQGSPSSAPGYVACALSGLALLSAIFLLPEPKTHQADAAPKGWLIFSKINVALARPSIGLILLSMFLTTFAFGQFETTLALLTERLGLGNRANFYTFAYVGFVLALSQGALVRPLVPKLGELRMSLFGTVLMVLGLLGVAVAAWNQSRVGLYAVMPICVMGFAALTPSLQSLLSRLSDPTEQGGILGIGQGTAALARILGPVAGVVLFERGVTYPYWCGAAIMALGALLISRLRGGPALE